MQQNVYVAVPASNDRTGQWAAQTLCGKPPRGPRLSKHLAIICWSNQLSSINLQMAYSSCVETVDFKLIVQILVDRSERFFEIEVN